MLTKLWKVSVSLIEQALAYQGNKEFLAVICLGNFSFQLD